MASQPILPSSRTNPVGQTDRIRKAERVLKRFLSESQDWLLGQFEQLPKQPLKVNQRYEYLISAETLRMLILEIEQRMGQAPSQAIIDQVAAAYEEGTGQAVANLQKITDQYTLTASQVLASQPYQRRVAMISARVFEQMRGFEGDTAADLARVLGQGVENGLNPIEVAKDIKKRFGVSKSRAERIARTEITGALRRGLLDEDADANQRLGIKTGLLWFSALSPTTRPWHASRHGNIYTQEDVREFYATGANGVNCLCSVRSIMIDENGDPITPRVVDKVKSYKK